MSEHFPLMIIDAPARSGSLPVTAPYDGALIAEVDTSGEQHVDKALDTAYALFRDRDRWLPLYRRIEILERSQKTTTRLPTYYHMSRFTMFW